MSAPVSVIIPVLNAADGIGPCLGALSEALFDGLIREVILVDGGSDDNIAKVAEGTGARLIETEQGRGLQLASGARAAHGDWFLFLHADSVLGPGWSASVRMHIQSHANRAGYFKLAFDDDGHLAGLTAGWANLRAAVFSMPYGDQGLLISRHLYMASGGYPEIPVMEDVALARRLRGKFRCLQTTLETSADRYRRHGWIKQGGGNLWRLMRYLAGADPADLARGYGR